MQGNLWILQSLIIYLILNLDTFFQFASDKYGLVGDIQITQQYLLYNKTRKYKITERNHGYRVGKIRARQQHPNWLKFYAEPCDKLIFPLLFYTKKKNLLVA